MTNEMTAGRGAARTLAAKTPGWMVWYGERTGSFWAVPRVTTRIVARLLEAPTAGDLEEEIRKAEGRSPRQATTPEQPAREQAGSEQPAREQSAPGGRVPDDRGSNGDAPRHRRPTADPQAPRVPVTH
ncbi:hypothetical protein AB0C10_05625 [Microbispora amethystogenes]|uniref:hypothetical protein n=1 Tax=Microbispora amethystogenes TaxID=1427754 RepID=UPI0033E87A85